MADITTTTDSDSAASGAATLVHTPQQDRSRRTLNRILDAGLELLVQGGPDALTVTGITKRARASVGSFYARFDGKDDLLKYLGERALEDTLAEWASALDEVPEGRKRRRGVRFVVSSVGSLYLEGAGRALVLLEGVEDPRPTRRARFEALLAWDLRELFDAPRVRTDLAARVLTGVLRDAAVRTLGKDAGGANALPYPEPDVLLPELVELLVGYLGGKVKAPQVDAPELAEAPPTRMPVEEPPATVEAPQQVESPEPERAAPITVDESPPEPAPEPEAQPDMGDESEREGPTPAEPDPFDVWG